MSDDEYDEYVRYIWDDYQVLHEPPDADYLKWSDTSQEEIDELNLKYIRADHPVLVDMVAAATSILMDMNAAQNIEARRMRNLARTLKQLNELRE